MFSINGLSFGFRPEELLFDDLHLNLPLSKISVLTGVNGSGKTTFCKLLTGLIANYKGNLLIEGQEQKKLSVPEIAEKVTFLKQEPAANIISALPKDDLKIWLHKFSPGEYDDSKVWDALNHFDIADQAEKPVWELSNGQLKRVGLAGLWLNKDKYWILDEPTSGLDTEQINHLLELIEAQKLKGKGMLIVSHRYTNFLKFADQILEIKDNKIQDIR